MIFPLRICQILALPLVPYNPTWVTTMPFKWCSVLFLIYSNQRESPIITSILFTWALWTASRRDIGSVDHITHYHILCNSALVGSTLDCWSRRFMLMQFIVQAILSYMTWAAAPILPDDRAIVLCTSSTLFCMKFPIFFLARPNINLLHILFTACSVNWTETKPGNTSYVVFIFVMVLVVPLSVLVFSYGLLIFAVKKVSSFGKRYLQ